MYLENGRVVDHGPYSDLMRTGGPFAGYMLDCETENDSSATKDDLVLKVAPESAQSRGEVVKGSHILIAEEERAQGALDLSGETVLRSISSLQ